MNDSVSDEEMAEVVTKLVDTYTTDGEYTKVMKIVMVPHPVKILNDALLVFGWCVTNRRKQKLKDREIARRN